MVAFCSCLKIFNKYSLVIKLQLSQNCQYSSLNQIYLFTVHYSNFLVCDLLTIFERKQLEETQSRSKVSKYILKGLFVVFQWNHLLGESGYVVTLFTLSNIYWAPYMTMVQMPYQMKEWILGQKFCIHYIFISYLIMEL